MKTLLSLEAYTWVEVFSERHDITISEALREAVRRFKLTEDDDVLERVSAAEREIEGLKRRVGRLESEVRTRDRQRKQLSRLATVQGASRELHEKEYKIRKLQNALEELQPRA